MEMPATPGKRAEQQEDMSRRLSPVDAAFLYLERKEIPLAIASVFVFDGPISFDQFLASIASRLHLIPRYRQIVVMPPYNLGYPTWEDDPNFDIRRHVFRVSIDPPGGDAELEDLAGRIFSQLLDRCKPLWECYVVEGMQDGRGAVIVRLHHSLADGIAGVSLVNLLLDTSPDGPGRQQRHRHRPRKAPPAPSLIDSIASAIDTSLQGLMTAEAAMLSLAQDLLSNPTRVKDLAGALPELAASVERLPFNKPCTGDRKFCWAEFDIADMAAIRDIAGATINDVILSVLTRALARYVKLHHQTVTNRYVRIVCPVNVRHGEQNGDLGNQISFMPVALPLDVSDPLTMLKGVASRTEAMKRGQAADVVALLASCIAAAPPPLQALFWWGIPQITLPVPLFNLICTNVPGSRVPLYSLGRKLIAAYPQVPTGYELGINVAVQSYDGKLFFGLIADAHVAPDVRRLRDFLYVSFRELCRSTGLKKPRKARAQKPKARPAEAGPVVVAEPVIPVVMDAKAVA